MLTPFYPAIYPQSSTTRRSVQGGHFAGPFNLTVREQVLRWRCLRTRSPNELEKLPSHDAGLRSSLFRR